MGCAASSSLGRQAQPQAIPHEMPRRQAIPHEMPRRAEQSAVEGLELSVELEQARQQIITLQQVLSRCYLHNLLNILFLF